MRFCSNRVGAFLVVCIAMGCCSAVSFAQSYPRWFLYPSEFRCGHAVVGFANASFYPDSAVAQAQRNGVENFVRQQRTNIQGGQLFWSTEAGTFWMGADFREDFDTNAVAVVSSRLKVLDKFLAKDIVVVLLGDSSCSVDGPLRAKLSPKSYSPPWVESPPAGERFYYAVGLSPEYFYETSSWAEAERMARRNLARNVFTQVRSLQKMSREGQDIRHEELSVTLRDIQVVARWRDVEKQIFYVLLRMQKTF